MSSSIRNWGLALAGSTASLLVVTACSALTATNQPKKLGLASSQNSVSHRVIASIPLRFNRDIQPILAANCISCHGPDSASRQAGLRLDRFPDEKAIQDHTAAILPGNPAASKMVRRITGQGPLMPPPSSHKSLTAAQIATLTRWVKEGAKYELHWSYIAPTRPALPTVKNPTWVRNPIDRFVLARLEKAGLTPAPEADRRTLARRVSLDLTGLPPEPADVEAFVKDKSPGAYEKLVDKYFASPHYGEHRARYWLDAARYADTNGIHFDNYREMWSYRDWVIHAFNQNMPFNQFTVEQLAGDLLPNPTMDQLVATGFNRCNITTSEGGAIDEEYKVLYARDRTETTSAVFLGSTLNCSVCHDHKFDPFTQKDFYSMTALFSNLSEPAMDGNLQNTPPVIKVPRIEDEAQYAKLTADLEAARKVVDARRATARADFEKGLGQADITKLAGNIPSDGLLLHAPLAEGQGREVGATLGDHAVRLTALADPGWETGVVGARAFQRHPGSTVEIPSAGDFEKDQAFSTAVWVKVPTENTGGSIVSRMDDQHDFRGWDVWLQGNHIATHLINTWPSNALKVVSQNMLSTGQWHHVCVSYSGGMKPESVHIYIDGVLQQLTVESDTLKDSIRAQVPFKIGQRSTTSGVDGTSIQDLRLYGRVLSADEVARLDHGTRATWLASRGAAQLSAPEKEELFAGWLAGTDEAYRKLQGDVAALDSQQSTLLMRGTEAHIMHQDHPDDAMAYILNRGEYDKRRDPVKPATPAVLPPLPADYPRNRLGFAKWLMRPEHPLTARVTVNRFWQEIFGVGIVRTPEDFGVNGEMPSHPELLDWLAVELRDGGWDMKKVFRTIVTSATYRQSAVVTPEKEQKDPKNILLSRGPRFRMDAEMVRDYALAASGLLVPKIGGPSVKPYQPDGVWEAVAIIGSNTRDYKRDMGENLYRRSMYTFWKRSAPPASLDVFNAPSREVCTVRRERTNTPLQALVTLNDPQYVEAARYLAQRALKEGGTTTNSQIDFLAHRLIARSLRPAEQAVVGRSLSELQSFYNTHSKEAAQLIAVGESKADPMLKPERLAAWTMLSNQMMNLDEVLNK